MTGPRLSGGGGGACTRKRGPVFRTPLGMARQKLLQRGIDRGELGAEFGTQPIHDRDDRKSNACRNQAILDGRGSIFVFQEIFDEVHARSRSVILSKQTVLDR